MLIYRELELTRSVKARDILARFFKSQTKWELLLLIAANNGAEEIGIWNYIDQLSTRTESPMTIYTFIRDRIEDGSLLLLQGKKKSRKVLVLSPQLDAALYEFLTRRYIVGASHVKSDADRDGDRINFTVPVSNISDTDSFEFEDAVTVIAD